MTRLMPALFLCLAAMSACGADQAASRQQGDQAKQRATRCDVPKTGPLSIDQLPEGRSVVDCDAVGRTVVWRGAGVTVPSPGEGQL